MKYLPGLIKKFEDVLATAGFILVKLLVASVEQFKQHPTGPNSLCKDNA